MAAELYIPEVDTSRDIYYRKDAAAYMDPAGARGNLSNMADGYSVRVNGIAFQSPEALFQAFKFPDNPTMQRRLARAPDGDYARQTGNNAPNVRADWDEVKLDAMRYACAAKLLCYPEFGKVLLKTGERPIVEMNFRDGWWCAVPDLEKRVMIGRNATGKVLEQLREEIHQTARNATEAAANIMNDTAMDYLWINGRPVTAHATPVRKAPQSKGA